MEIHLEGQGAFASATKLTQAKSPPLWCRAARKARAGLANRQCHEKPCSRKPRYSTKTFETGWLLWSCHLTGISMRAGDLFGASRWCQIRQMAGVSKSKLLRVGSSESFEIDFTGGWVVCRDPVQWFMRASDVGQDGRGGSRPISSQSPCKIPKLISTVQAPSDDLNRSYWCF
jgi:hypothetical protein